MAASTQPNRKPYDGFDAERCHDEILTELARFPGEVLNPDPDPGSDGFVRARLFSYASRMVLLDAILDKLGTKMFCARLCERKPFGCCWEFTHRMGNEDFFELLALQEVEARRNGLMRPGRRCRYHTGSGCALKLFKPPVCLRFFCPSLAQASQAEFGPEAAGFYLLIKDLSLDLRRSATILLEIDRAIRAGTRLIRNPGNPRGFES